MPETPEHQQQPAENDADATSLVHLSGSGADAAGAAPAGPGNGTDGGDASGSGPEGTRQPRPRLRPVLIAGAVPIAVALVGLLGTMVTLVLKHDSNSDGTNSQSGSSPTITITTTGGPTPSPSPTAVSDRTCVAKPKKVHGISAAFVAPCTGDKVNAPDFDATLAVPTYPADDGSDGSVWVFVKILNNGMGGPLNDPPMYATYPVRPGTARSFTATTWTKDLMAYQTCHDYGKAQVLTYWLSAHDKAAIGSWKPGKPVTLPHDVVLLDSVLVNVEATC